jgi:hypothetical protein
MRMNFIYFLVSTVIRLAGTGLSGYVFGRMLNRIVEWGHKLPNLQMYALVIAGLSAVMGIVMIALNKFRNRAFLIDLVLSVASFIAAGFLLHEKQNLWAAFLFASAGIWLVSAASEIFKFTSRSASEERPLSAEIA